MHAVLLLNLGSPRSYSVKDVRSYLNEFLSDERVLDGPYWFRKLILHACILPFRPKRSAEAYKSVWTKDGSPLLCTSYKQRDLLQAELDCPVAVAMRYGSPSIPDVIQELRDKGVSHLFVMPLYPQYAMSSYETVLVKTMDCIEAYAPDMQVKVLQPFYEDPDYIEALCASAKPYLSEGFDHLLFTFHGLPKRHLGITDCSKAHCLKRKNCCKLDNPAHATCYRHQCFKVVELFTNKLGLDPKTYSVSFQSRLLRDPWLDPFTDHTVTRLAKEGTKRLLVISPSFVADCLETLEEIAIAAKENFLEHGGESLQLIPCLNEHPLFIRFLKKQVQPWLAQSKA